MCYCNHCFYMYSMQTIYLSYNNIQFNKGRSVHKMKEITSISTYSIYSPGNRHKDHHIDSMHCTHICMVHNMSFYRYMHPCSKCNLYGIFCHRHTDICFYQECSNVGIFCSKHTHIFLHPACSQVDIFYHRYTDTSCYQACS